MKTRDTNQDATPRAAKSRREIGSENGTTPNHTQSGICPIRLAAVDNAEVTRGTWMDCLRDLRAHLTAIKNGGDVEPHAVPIIDQLFALLLICIHFCNEASFCPETNSNHALALLLFESINYLSPKMPTIFRYRHLRDFAEALPDLSGLALKIISEEDVAKNLENVAGNFFLPYCPCSSCHIELWLDYLSALNERATADSSTVGEHDQ